MTSPRDEWREGWRNVLAAAIGLGFGVPSYGPVASLFLRSLEQEFGWSKAVAAGALVALPATALLLPAAGRLIDRHGVRGIVAISVACSVACHLGLSRLNGSVGQYYALIAALYVLGCATGPIAYTRLVAAQFRAARGTALAVAQFGIALIGVIMPPIVGAIMERWSWREGYLLFAATTLAGGLAACLLMRPTPIDGRTADASVSAWTFVRRGSLWLLGVPILLISVASYGFVFQFQSVLVSLGIDARSATLLLSVLAFSTMTSRLVVGRLLDSARPTTWSAALMALAALGPLLLLLPSPGITLVVVAVMLVGISIGAELDLMSFFCARAFGMASYSVVYGVLSIFFFVGMALGAVVFGAIFDVTGTYGPALFTMSALLGSAALLFGVMGAVERARVPLKRSAVAQAR